MASARVFVKKQIQLDKFNLNQTYMFKLGTVALAAVKNRVQRGINGNDARSKPLCSSYKRFKAKNGKKIIRDLTFTGDMLRNLQVRSASNNRASATLSTRKDRYDKAGPNQKREPWLLFSRKNREELVPSIQKILEEMLHRLARALPGA